MINGIRENLINSIYELSSELNRTGKSETADYFSKLAEDIRSSQDVTKLLEKILKGSAISQYADFTNAEDSLFSEVYEGAKIMRTHTEQGE